MNRAEFITRTKHLFTATVLPKSTSEMIEELADELGLEPEAPKPWPQKGDCVYVLGNDGMTDSVNWGAYLQLDLSQLKMGCVYPTREASESASTKIRARVRIENYIKENFGEFVPDWTNVDQGKYSIIYKGLYKTFNCERHSHWQLLTLIPYVANERYGKQVIKDCLDDLKIVFGIA